jgi:hypothetical protein
MEIQVIDSSGASMLATRLFASSNGHVLYQASAVPVRSAEHALSEPRADGRWIRFDDNGAILLNKREMLWIRIDDCGKLKAMMVRRLDDPTFKRLRQMLGWTDLEELDFVPASPVQISSNKDREHVLPTAPRPILYVAVGTLEVPVTHNSNTADTRYRDHQCKVPFRSVFPHVRVHVLFANPLIPNTVLLRT